MEDHQHDDEQIHAAAALVAHEWMPVLPIWQIVKAADQAFFVGDNCGVYTGIVPQYHSPEPERRGPEAEDGGGDGGGGGASAQKEVVVPVPPQSSQQALALTAKKAATDDKIGGGSLFFKVFYIPKI